MDSESSPSPDSPESSGHDLGTSSLSNLESNDQRIVLDLISQLRKCGLSGDISLPQMVVCGQQSAGKSSLLEALTEVPFPTNDDLCTRYATVIHIRKADVKSLSIKIIPGESRSVVEKMSINAFDKNIDGFDDLPAVMDTAMTVMGINKDDKSGKTFAEDVLSIEIEGPNRPQLTLVDIPGLIATATGSATDADVALVAAITDRYIAEPRTICLAVVAGGSHHATQAILERVRQVDPKGNRTLGIITKPDRIESEGSQATYLGLAQNSDIKLKLGWHVIKNRTAKEARYTLDQRKSAEAEWFSTSAFKGLSSDQIGIDSLRKRLSLVLFEHIRRELPKLKAEVESKLDAVEQELRLMGKTRSTAQQCKTFLTEMSMRYYQTCKAAMDGHYESGYFQPGFEISDLKKTSRRARAVIQTFNIEFETAVRKNGRKYHIGGLDDAGDSSDHEEGMEGREETDPDSQELVNSADFQWPCKPKSVSKRAALKWVQTKMKAARGKELVGSFNPLLIGELFWEQSSKWHEFASSHLERIAEFCTDFLKGLLEEECPSDVHDRLWDIIEVELKTRKQAADDELQKIRADFKEHPSNYNHYYTDTITKYRRDEQTKRLKVSIQACFPKPIQGSTQIDLASALSSFSQNCNPDMESHAGEEALMSLMSLYKVMSSLSPINLRLLMLTCMQVKQKVFVDIITVQVIERHIVRGLEDILSPIVVSELDDEDVMSIAGEPKEVHHERIQLELKIKKLQEGRAALKLAGSKVY